MEDGSGSRGATPGAISRWYHLIMQVYTHTATIWGRVLQVYRQSRYVDDYFPRVGGPSRAQYACAHRYPDLAAVRIPPRGAVVCTACDLLIDVFPTHSPESRELMSTFWDSRVDGPGPAPPPPGLPPPPLPRDYFVRHDGQFRRSTRSARLTMAAPLPLYLTY